MTRKLTYCMGLVLLLLSLAVTLTLPKQSHAMPATTTSCTNSPGCVAYQLWNSGVSDHGSATNVQMSGANDTYFAEYIYDASTHATERVGVEKGSGFCPGSNLHWFYQDSSSNGTTTGCPGDVNTNDINNGIFLSISYYVSNGGGFFFVAEGNFDAPCPATNPCSIGDSNGPTPFTASIYYVENQTGSFTGHHMWGIDFSRNQYFNNGVWAFDGTSGSQVRTHSGCSSNCTPPQMYWKNPPNGNSNNGGDLYACLYDSTSNSCTIGS